MLRWSQMSNAQRSFLTAHARWQPVIVQGVVVGHEPKGYQPARFSIEARPGCPYACAIVSAKAADRDITRSNRETLLREAPRLIAEATERKGQGASVIVTKIKKGYARGWNDLNRPRAKALPMGQGINGRV